MIIDGCGTWHWLVGVSFVGADQSDVDLRHSLANLVAVVLGSPSRSNHLWFHLFAADRLEGTYMTGFMVRGLCSL